MFNVIATGEFYADMGIAADDVSPVDLTELTRNLCRERFRRIDRFTQLALIGSARCVGETVLPGDAGLYIGSGLGAIGNTIAVHEHLFLRRKVPKPADFINTLSNSAGYYVARNLGLRAQNVFVSRRAASMEAAFETVALEFETGGLDLALIGIVDECTAPTKHHAYRIDVDETTPLAEGSHWFLVRREDAPIGIGRVIAARTIVGTSALVEWLSNICASGEVLLNCGPEVDATGLGELASLPRFDPDLGVYLSRGAGVLARYFDSDIQQRLITVGCGSHERFHVTFAEKN